MRIVRMEAATVRVDLVKPYVTADYPGEGLSHKQCVILRLFSDSGLYGIGEADPYPTFTYESSETVLQILRQHLGPAILGMDPRDLVALHQRLDQSVRGWPFAKAPIDIAAHDLVGKAWGVPVYQLLGGRLRDRVPMIWPIGGGSPQENALEARARVEAGFGSLHVKIGALAPSYDLARVEAVRKAAGSDVPLMLDANQGWDRSTALRMISKLEQWSPSMVEQPVPAWDLDGMATIQAAVDTPISADESLHGLHDAMNLVRRNAARIFSLKHGKCGGLLRVRQIAAIAEAAGLPCFVNSMVEMGVSVAASLHLAASLPNLVDHGHALMSNLRIQEDIVPPESFAYSGKDILVPDHKPGLGIDLDYEELESRTQDHFVLEL
jgi:L-alanine-DL-glutamate epimerase-like enolase superfamily enzyme